MSVRDDVADALSLALPDADVHAWARNLDAINRATVLVELETVEPPSVACPTRLYGLELVALSPYTDNKSSASDDAIDDVLEAVLGALDALGIRWTRAQRGVWQELFPAYRITVEVQP